MSDKVVNFFNHVKDKDGEQRGAIKRVLLRPFPHPRELATEDQMVSWFLEGLWLEGYSIVRTGDDE
jgi:hypothetical protein